MDGKRLQELNQWALSQSSEGRTSAAAPSDADKAFLERVIDEQSDTKTMLACRAVFMAADSTIDQLEEALDALLGRVEYIDNASVMPNLGLVDPVVALFEHEAAGVRAGALWVLSTALHDNDKLFAQVYTKELLSRIMTMTRNDSSADVRSKGLTCVSAILGGHASAQEAFMEDHGISLLQDILEGHQDATSSSAQVRKCVFFMGKIARQNEHFVSAFTTRECLSALTALLAFTDDTVLCEKVVECLTVLLTECGGRRSAVSTVLVALGLEERLAQLTGSDFEDLQNALATLRSLTALVD